MLDDAYLWTTAADAEAMVFDGDNEVLETTGALICSDCQVKPNREQGIFGFGRLLRHLSRLAHNARHVSCDLHPAVWRRLTLRFSKCIQASNDKGV